ncbi:MAG: hypothetical protein DRN14_03740 [Thermoplasmata archaeon]|nr:MAG: hypothetical protein DRN14_03740 [Thermoplasmata archaeon]
MPRPRLRKIIRFRPSAFYFKPRGIPMKDLEEVVLTMEEMESLRLKDYKNLDQVTAAEKMKTSQSTFQRILTSARQKIALAIVEGKALEIERE